jgi:NFU1 iron-sulfur cluster scaffold homolog, mitochondrial
VPIGISQTPNPNALKFSVPDRFDTPMSFAAGTAVDDPLAADLVSIPGVAGVFMSADFITISKKPDAYWDEIAPEATRILEERYGR